MNGLHLAYRYELYTIYMVYSLYILGRGITGNNGDQHDRRRYDVYVLMVERTSNDGLSHQACRVGCRIVWSDFGLRIKRHPMP